MNKHKLILKLKAIADIHCFNSVEEAAKFYNVTIDDYQMWMDVLSDSQPSKETLLNALIRTSGNTSSFFPKAKTIEQITLIDEIQADIDDMDDIQSKTDIDDIGNSIKQHIQKIRKALALI